MARPGGIQPFTFVEEYLGEVHTGGGHEDCPHSKRLTSPVVTHHTALMLGCMPTKDVIHQPPVVLEVLHWP